MQQRRIGSQGLTVSAIGVGCMPSANAVAPPDEALTSALLGRAVELGVTLFDTAEAYGPYVNEINVGKALRAVRDRVVIASKFGYRLSADSRLPLGLDSRPERIREACDGSLKRLGVETIDLLFQHRVDPAVPIEDVAGAVAGLIKAGKVRFFGLCEAAPDTIRRAHRVQPISAVESEYSLWTRESETSILPLCRELDIGFVAYSPLGRGFLAGSGTQLSDLPEGDYRRGMPRWQADALAHNRRLFEQFQALAASKNCTPAQLALAWLLHRQANMVPIPGTTKLHRLEENIAAAQIRLSPDDLAAVEQIISPETVAGARYDQTQTARLNR
ncbi:MAG TPA: aldo/keto reductase [Steroidobacteraceae bacterium]|jgi:aryl-alcohol dehydrogenase-like predicted oxidoreductase|nr:aldo/keto reductase [Steroidobacteraceae bacterium]